MMLLSFENLHAVCILHGLIAMFAASNTRLRAIVVGANQTFHARSMPRAKRNTENDQAWGKRSKRKWGRGAGLDAGGRHLIRLAESTESDTI